MYVDVHCHLGYPPLNAQLDSVVEKARKAGLGMVITAGTNPKANDDVLSIAARYPDIVKASLGLYPLDALGFDEPEAPRKRDPFDVDAEISRMASLADKCVAIGEVGMDFKFAKEPPLIAKQKEIFGKIIEMAEAVKKPMIVHTRNAELEVVEMLETTSNKAIVLHCFMGRKSLIRRASDNGWCFSVPSVIKRLQHFQVLSGMVPIEQLLTETDAPWLSPVVGQINEPSTVVVGVEEIAKVKRVEPSVVKDIIWKNAQRLFG
jgi:TatD DNase family protein